jgi:cell wall-associated NlpC family hydrolase
VISAALDVRHQAKFRTDCSHFVHGLYQRAGFPYTYAPSAALYAGIDAFERVTNPQPGDLAVWRGHAGIVVNPAQHSFFSLMTSGIGIASYDSSYWKKKGRPRFFRYVRALPEDERPSSVWTASR